MLRSAVVVGAGPAGLSAALGLLRLGLSVDVHEQRAEWGGRVCGSFVNADGVRALHWLGLLDNLAPPVAVTVDETVLTTSRGHRTRLSTLQQGTAAMAVSRRALELILADGVRRAGGRIHAASRVTDVSGWDSHWMVRRRVGAREETVSADLVVRADGRFSAGAPADRDGLPVGLARAASGQAGWYGWNAGFSGVRQSPGQMSLHFTPSGYAGVLTFGNGLTNICGLVRREGGAVRWEDVFRSFQRENAALNDLVAEAVRLDDWRGVGPLPFSSRPRRQHGVLLAGDAAAVADPYMGEGIGRSLATGPLIFQAAEESGLTDARALCRRYEDLLGRSYGRRLSLGRAARWLLDRPALSGRVIGGILKPVLLNRATPFFHRGAGFAARTAETSTRS